MEKSLSLYIDSRSKDYAGAVKNYVAEEMINSANFLCEKMTEEISRLTEDGVEHFTEYGEGTLNGLAAAQSAIKLIWKEVDNLSNQNKP